MPQDFNPRGTTPEKLLVFGQEFPVTSWADVLRCTIDAVTSISDDQIILEICNRYSRYINMSGDGMRRAGVLPNGIHYERHLNSEQIHRICLNVVQTAGLHSTDDWAVVVNAPSADS